MEIPFQSIATHLTNCGISYLFIKVYFYKHVNPKKYGLCVAMEQDNATSISGHHTTKNGSFMSANT